MENTRKSNKVHLKVPFYDLDPLQIVWHGNYLKYFDMARAALFDGFNVDLFSYYKKTNYIFPIAKTFKKHIFPLRYRDEFYCQATLIEVKFKIIVDFEIQLIENGKLCAKGRSEQVAVKTPEMEIMFEIPKDIQFALGF